MFVCGMICQSAESCLGDSMRLKKLYTRRAKEPSQLYVHTVLIRKVMNDQRIEDCTVIMANRRCDFILAKTDFSLLYDVLAPKKGLGTMRTTDPNTCFILPKR